jgi:hypothetical protein
MTKPKRKPRHELKGENKVKIETKPKIEEMEDNKLQEESISQTEG